MPISEEYTGWSSVRINSCPNSVVNLYTGLRPFITELDLAMSNSSFLVPLLNDTILSPLLMSLIFLNVPSNIRTNVSPARHVALNAHLLPVHNIGITELTPLVNLFIL